MGCIHILTLWSAVIPHPKSSPLLLTMIMMNLSSSNHSTSIQINETELTVIDSWSKYVRMKIILEVQDLMILFGKLGGETQAFFGSGHRDSLTNLSFSDYNRQSTISQCGLTKGRLCR